MTAIKGTLARVLVDEWDFSTNASGVTVTVGMAEEECTTLQGTASVYKPILPSMKIEQNGYLSGVKDAGTAEDILYDRLGVEGAYVAALFGTDVAACPAYVLDSTFGQTMQFGVPVAGLMTLNGAWGMGGGGSRGLRIFSGTLSATGAQTAYDFTSAGSAGGEAYLFVQTITGSATNAAIKVQSCATEGGSYDDEGTFTFSSVDGYKVSMSGTVNRWLKINCTSLGGATNFTVVCIACVDGVTQ